MKVLMISTPYFPEEPSGAGRLGYDLARAYAGEGHDVTIVAQSRNPRVPEKVVEDGLTVLRYALPPSGRLDVRRHVKHLHATRRLLGRHVPAPPDVLHGHDLLPHAAALDHFGDRLARTCYSIHSPAVEELAIAWETGTLGGRLKRGLGLPIMRRYERRVLERSSALSAESEFTRTSIARDYGEAVGSRIAVIPGWIDTRRFAVLSEAERAAAREMLGWPLNRPVFFVLRRLETRMGLDRLLHAVADVKQSGHRPFVAIAGHGSARPSLETLRTELHLEEDVEFLGRVPEEQIPLQYGACDASVIPTRALECFGIIALEAMAAGRPVLVTPVGSLAEVVGPFEPGWIAAGNGAEDIAAMLRRFLEGALPAHEPQAVATYVRDRFDFSRARQRYVELLGLSRS